MSQKPTIGIPAKRYSIGICYVIIPSDINREKYIKDCFRNGNVSVQFENGGFLHRVPVCENVLQSIDFPSEFGKLGSCLVYNNEHNHNQPIIIGKLLKNDEISNLSENEFRLEKHTINGSVLISGKANEGNLFVNVSGKSDNGGKIFIDIKNPDKKGEVVVNLQGDFRMEVQNVVLNVLKQIGILSKEDINIDSETVINVGTKDNVQATFKGDDTVVQLKKEVKALTDLLTSISNITPSTVPANAIDPTWAIWQAAVSSITDRGDYDSVQSEKVFIE